MSKKASIIHFVLTLSIVCLFCGSAFAAGGAGHAIDYDNLHVNWWAWDAHAPPVGWFIVDFILFVGLLVYFTKRPIAESFKERALGIKQSIASAKKAFMSAQENHNRYQGKVAGAEAEITKLEVESRKAGMTERDTRIKNAQLYSERMRGDAQKVINQELDKAHVRLQYVVAQKALALAEEWIRSTLSEADRKALSENAIAELENGVQVQITHNANEMASYGAQL